MNKVVARYADGRVVKGSTGDFDANKDVFHVHELGAPFGTPSIAVRMSELKAVIFVKDLAGDPSRVDRDELDPTRERHGRPVMILFKDGEILLGTTGTYRSKQRGFFIEPADEGSNILRMYVIVAATEAIEFP